MSVADILEQMAANAGRSKLQRGQILGDVVAQAAQVPAQILADREKAALLARQQAMQDATAQYAKNADARAGSDQAMQERAAAQALQDKADWRQVSSALYRPGGALDYDAAAAKAQEIGRPDLIDTLNDHKTKNAVKPIFAKPGEVGFDPRTLQPLPGMSIPANKPDYTGPDGIRYNGAGVPITGTIMKPQGAPKSIEAKNVLLDGKPAIVNFDPSTGKHALPDGTDVSTRVKPIPAASITIRNMNAQVPTLPDWALDDSRPTGPEANKLDPTIRMTPNGLFQAAQTYIATGQFPPTARGADDISKNTRSAITSKVGAIAASSGMDEPALRAFYKSNVASLNQQQKMQDSVQGFMATADKNAALLQESLKAIPDTGIPLFNQPVRAFAKNVAGNKDLSQFATYLQSVQNEYARIISQPNLAGQLTDSARHEAETLLDPKATVPQILASVDALQKEGNNRLVSVGEQIKRIQGRMQVGPSTTTSPTAPVLKEGQEGTVNGVPAVWKTVDGKSGWYKK